MSQTKELTHEDVKNMVAKYMNEEHVALVERAYHFAAVAHQGQVRKSGEPYIIHPIQSRRNPGRIKDGPGNGVCRLHA